MAQLRRSMLGRRLRAMRLRHGWSQAQAAREAGVSDGTISNAEVGRTGVTPMQAVGLAMLYEASKAEVDEVRRMAKRAAEEDWYEPHNYPRQTRLNMLLALESVAESIRDYQSELIPGLLQTEKYAYRILENHPLVLTDEVAAVSEFKKKRRAEFWGSDDLPETHFIIAEAALHRVPGDIRDEQLKHLRDMAERTDITILPDRVGIHPSMTGNYTLVLPRVQDVPPVVYIETAGGSRYEESEIMVAAHEAVWESTVPLTIPYGGYEYHVA